MANTTWYGDGLASVAVGSRTVTGTDTGWLTEVAGLTPIKAGDKFGIHVGRPIVIEQIISDTELLLADDWPGPAQTDAPYKVELTSPTIAAVEAMRRLLASLSNGNLDSLSEITIGTDDIPIGIGPGVFSTINKAALIQGVDYDVFVPNLAGRAAYNGAAADFAVLVIDIGDGRSALYFKNSATSGDWSAPSYVTGPVGPAGVNQRGNYSAGTAYAIRDIVQYGGSTWIAKVATTGNAPPTLPTTENTQWLLFARSGTPGVVDRGAYSGATAYEANDIVLNNGSTWIAIQPTTGNAPPTLPTESNAYWRLLARKGTDGTGTGDVVGPASSVAGRVAIFSGATGKVIDDGGILLSDLVRMGRNLIINGQGRVNQRSYVSGAATTVANQYTLDRWRVVVSGQNLSFTGNNSKRTMTAPAGGVEQVIEGLNVEGGTYTINWTGTATCTVDGTARAKGSSFTLTANTNVTVRFSGGTFTDVQLESGGVPTVFERLLYEDELRACKRYYQSVDLLVNAIASSGSQDLYGIANLPVEVRAVPTVVPTGGTFINCTLGTYPSTTKVASFYVLSSAAGVVYGYITANLNAEL